VVRKRRVDALVIASVVLLANTTAIACDKKVEFAIAKRTRNVARSWTHRTHHDCTACSQSIAGYLAQITTGKCALTVRAHLTVKLNFEINGLGAL
jgi:hypothetical protein